MAGDGLPGRRRPGPRRRALPAGPSTAGARRSAPGRARYWGLAGGGGQQSVVTDAVEPVGQNVEQEAPDELVGRERHRAKARLAVAAVVLVAEAHAVLVEGEQAAGREGD